MTHSRVAAAVLFDVDGTLVDSNYLHVAAWLDAFASVGHPVESWRVHAAIGLDSALLLSQLLGADADLLGDAAKKRHQQVYASTNHLLTPFPGARDLIHALVERDVRVVLATSAPNDELELLRSVLDVDALLTAVTNADDVDTAKPDPDIVHVAQHRSGCPADRVVFVGDSAWDMQAALRAGIGRVALRSGGIGDTSLSMAGAEEIYDDPADLLAHLGQGRLAPLL
jgi:HAD superfamily hydrolase (TIGR01509 family)